MVYANKSRWERRGMSCVMLRLLILLFAILTFLVSLPFIAGIYTSMATVWLESFEGASLVYCRLCSSTSHASRDNMAQTASGGCRISMAEEWPSTSRESLVVIRWAFGGMEGLMLSHSWQTHISLEKKEVGSHVHACRQPWTNGWLPWFRRHISLATKREFACSVVE
jgi:hypothetical protein